MECPEQPLEGLSERVASFPAGNAKILFKEGSVDPVNEETAKENIKILVAWFKKYTTTKILLTAYLPPVVTMGQITSSLAWPRMARIRKEMITGGLNADRFLPPTVLGERGAFVSVHSAPCDTKL